MRRREFSKDVYAQIVRRAMLPSGEIACEGCGLVLGRKPYHVDHIIADGLQTEKSKKLTAKDGQLLGVECCHNPKTREKDVPAIARAKRNEAKHLNFEKPRKQPIRSANTLRTKPAREPKQSLPPRRLFEAST